MIRDELATGNTGDWQQLALIFFMALFVVIVVLVFRRGKKEEYEALKHMPLQTEDARQNNKGTYDE